MHTVARRLFPRRSDYSDLPWNELLPELARFGVVTRGAFTRLMKRHRRQLIAIDRDPLSPREVAYFKQEYGEAFVSDALRRHYWFALQALVRTAMELEFGEGASVWENPEDAPDHLKT
jgi:hypothetical protein